MIDKLSLLYYNLSTLNDRLSISFDKYNCKKKGRAKLKISAMKIETILAKRGMTKTSLAFDCGMSRQNISAIIRRGTCEPKTAGRLAAGLGVDVADIVDFIERGDHRVQT